MINCIVRQWRAQCITSCDVIFCTHALYVGLVVCALVQLVNVVWIIIGLILGLCRSHQAGLRETNRGKWIAKYLCTKLLPDHLLHLCTVE